MAVPTYIFYILATLLVIGCVVGLFLLGLKLERLHYRKLSLICNILCFIVFFTGAMAGYIGTDDRYSGDLIPTLIIANDNGELETRKIITPYYHGIPIHFRFRGGSYIVDNRTTDTIQIVNAFYHFYNQSATEEDTPTIEAELAPSEISIVKHKPVAIVPILPSQRYFKVSKLGNSGRGRSATYILRK